jgi:ribonuclease VapC
MSPACQPDRATVIAIDTSALIAILRGEPEADALLRTIVAAERCHISALSLLEASMVLAGRTGDATAWTELDQLVEAAGITIVAHDAAQSAAARSAFLRFGKGRHPAALNLGDCASYALAKERGLPLLFKGEDFSKTDIGVAT